MANNNETVASEADCIRHLADTLPNGVILNIAQCNLTADRIESAWRREKRPRRNCDRFADCSTAKHAWHEECFDYAESIDEWVNPKFPNHEDRHRAVSIRRMGRRVFQDSLRE